MIKQLACGLAFALATSKVFAGEWGAWPHSNSTYVAAGIEQDGAALIVICDAERMRISLGFEEPHARWQKGAQMNVVTIAEMSIASTTAGSKPGPRRAHEIAPAGSASPF
jgi:hypothetical protein